MTLENLRKKLEDLLLTMFSPDELRRFLRFGHFGTDLERMLPGREVSAARLAEGAVEALQTRNLISHDLWSRLKEERPRWGAEIDEMAEFWCQGGVHPRATELSSVDTQALEGERTSPKPAFLVATALSLEYRAFGRHIQRNRTTCKTTAGTLLEVGMLATPSGSIPVAMVETGHGNEDAGLVVSDALSYFPDLKGVLFVGVAGGVKDVVLGDVVVSDRVYAYEYGKDTKSFIPRPHIGNAAHRFLQCARAVSRGTAWLSRANTEVNLLNSPRAFIGPIAAGSKVVTSRRSAAARVVQQHYSDVLAIEMEGYGAMRAAWLRNMEAIVIRGISDRLGNKTKSDKEGWQEKGAAHAAAFAAEMLGGL